MPAIPDLPLRLHEKLGDEAMNELANILQELREADARLEAGLASVRQEITGLRAEVKQDIVGLGADLKIQIASAQAELVKWTFLFWVGTIGLVVLLLRFPR